MKLKKCIEKIKNCEVVSFDIFDTLVNRCIGNPKEIYLLIEQELRLKYGNKFEGFANKRIWAEKMAVATSKYGEVTLEEIYNFLELENKSEVTCLEKNIEIEISTVNDEMFDLYQECRHMKKRIFLCSDMYLDKETIKAILDKNGYVEYEKLYLSSERRKRKSDGSLYRELKQELKIDSKKIIHIGDNIKSDYLQPIRYGLNAYHYRKPKRYMRNTLSPYNILSFFRMFCN